MAETGDEFTTDSAEKAYAVAAEGATDKPETEVAEPASPHEFPAKTDRVYDSQPAPASEMPVVDLPPELEADLVKSRLKQAAAVPAKPKPAKKPAPARKAPALIKKAAASKAPKVSKPTPAPKHVTIVPPKEKFMATKKSAAPTKDLKAVVADVQAKAKVVLGKGTVVFGEAKTFTKGNVDALVESGKILSTGIKGLGLGYVAEGKAAIETVKTDVKALKAVKSPTELVKLQGTITRRNVDHAIDLSKKNSEAVIKLLNSAFAPLSARATLAAAVFKKAA